MCFIVLSFIFKYVLFKGGSQWYFICEYNCTLTRLTPLITLPYCCSEISIFKEFLVHFIMPSLYTDAMCFNNVHSIILFSSPSSSWSHQTVPLLQMCFIYVYMYRYICIYMHTCVYKSIFVFVYTFIFCMYLLQIRENI
jgi:hypothetical protein